MRYYCIRQQDMRDCGVACLATISKTYGMDISISRIREVAGTDLHGTNVNGLVHAAEALGFYTRAVKGSREAFLEKMTLPAIAHVIKDKKYLHYVVVYKITDKKVVISDPAEGIIKYTIDEFLEIWTGVMVLLSPRAKLNELYKSNNYLKSFFSLLVPQKKLLLQIYFAAIVVTFFGIIGSFYYLFIMDYVLIDGAMKTLHIVTLGIIILYLFKCVMEYFKGQLMLLLSQKIDIPLILGYYYHVLDLPMNFFGTRRIGEIVSRFMDASKIRDAISGASLSLIIDTTMGLFGGALLYTRNAELFFIAVIMIILYGIIVLSFNGPIRKVNEAMMEENAQLNSFLVESLNGIETVKSFGIAYKIKHKTEIHFVKFLKKLFRNGTILNIQKNLSTLVAVLGETCILWIGTVKVLEGDMSIGELITFNSLLAYFLEPIKNLFDLQPQIQTAVVAAKRIGEILELEVEEKEKENKIKDISIRQDIVFENVNFKYGTRRLVLRDIDMCIRAGSKIALVGESGSGKTTLAKLLLNFYELQQGQITIGDMNIKDIDKMSLRNKIAYISQDIFMFNGTIMENLMIGNEEATMQEIIDVCKLTQLDDFINNLPLRYDTEIEENGINLSGGQKQRLAIARALIKKPDLLIMDEATSNLDSITEKAIEKMIDEMDSKMTIIIIAHRLSTIKKCDKIFVMKDGKIIEEGNHNELLDLKKEYFSLWEEQLID